MDLLPAPVAQTLCPAAQMKFPQSRGSRLCRTTLGIDSHRPISICFRRRKEIAQKAAEENERYRKEMEE